MIFSNKFFWGKRTTSSEFARFLCANWNTTDSELVIDNKIKLSIKNKC